MAAHGDARELADFLRARISEQQGRRREVIAAANPATPLLEAAINTGLAEGEAMLEVIDYLGLDADPPAGPVNATAADDIGKVATDVLRLLATPYARHPDYREEWRT